MSDELLSAMQNCDYDAIMSLLEGGRYLLYLELVTPLIDCGMDLNLRDRGGETLVMLAAQAGDLEMVKLLLDNGADACGEDRNGRTALMKARRNLFERISNMNIWAVEEMTGQKYHPPSWSDKLREWWTRRKIAHLLMKAGGTCYERDPEKRRYGATMRLLYALPHPDDGPFNLFAQAKEAVATGADVNSGWMGENVLTQATIVATSAGDDRFLKLLLRAGADVNARNKDGTTALQHAKNSPRVIRLLKNAGAKE